MDCEGEQKNPSGSLHGGPKGVSFLILDDRKEAIIYLGLLSCAGLYELLDRVDGDLALAVRGRGCGRCGGPLHRSDYDRKPRGADGLPSSYARRQSFCCGREGCRRRATPPSVRFLGRRVYLAAVVLLCSAMQHGVNRRRADELRRLIGASEPTLRRWRRWWLTEFVATPTWRCIRGMLGGDISVDVMPLSLVERVVEPRNEERLTVLLRLLRPLTTVTCTL